MWPIAGGPVQQTRTGSPYRPVLLCFSRSFSSSLFPSLFLSLSLALRLSRYLPFSTERSLATRPISPPTAIIEGHQHTRPTLLFCSRKRDRCASHIYVYTCVCVCVYIYTHSYTPRAVHKRSPTFCSSRPPSKPPGFYFRTLFPFSFLPLGLFLIFQSLQRELNWKNGRRIKFGALLIRGIV